MNNSGLKVNKKPEPFRNKRGKDSERGIIRVGIACGGTGGHIFPGLAVADVLIARGHEVTLWVTEKAWKIAALKNWKGIVVTVKSRSLSSFFSWRIFYFFFILFTTLIDCLKTMRRDKPDVMLGMGSYASIAPVLAAKRLGIPLILHEANVIPGRATRFLSHFATTVATGFEETKQTLRHAPNIFIGMPLRDTPNQAHKDERWQNLSKGNLTILIMGGSQGAHTLNTIISSVIITLRNQGGILQVIHLSGASDADMLQAAYRRNGVPAAVFGFLDSVGEAYKRASFAICRSGASTCAELLHYSVPALLVPYPFATHQHQLANARALEKIYGAIVREEKDFTKEWLTTFLRRLMNGEELLERMKQAAKQAEAHNASAALADLVEGIARKAE